MNIISTQRKIIVIYHGGTIIQITYEPIRSISGTTRNEKTVKLCKNSKNTTGVPSARLETNKNNRTHDDLWGNHIWGKGSINILGKNCQM